MTFDRHPPLNAGQAVDYDDVARMFNRERINEVRFPLDKMRLRNVRHRDNRRNHDARENHGLDATVASVAIRAIKAIPPIIAWPFMQKSINQVDYSISGRRQVPR